MILSKFTKFGPRWIRIRRERIVDLQKMSAGRAKKHTCGASDETLSPIVQKSAFPPTFFSLRSHLLIAMVEDPVRSFMAMIASLINPIVAMVPFVKLVRWYFCFDAPISTLLCSSEVRVGSGRNSTWALCAECFKRFASCECPLYCTVPATFIADSRSICYESNSNASKTNHGRPGYYSSFAPRALPASSRSSCRAASLSPLVPTTRTSNKDADGSKLWHSPWPLNISLDRNLIILDRPCAC